MAVIGLLTTSYPRAEGDPAGLFVRGFARALASRGHRIEVLAPEPSSGGTPIADRSIDVRWIPYARPRAMARTFYGAGVIDNVRRDPRAWPGLITYPLALASAARQRVRGWDAIVSHWALPCAIAAASVRGARPHLAVLHSGDVHLMRQLPFRSRWASAVGDGATQLLFTSSPLRTELLSWLAPIARADLAGRCHVSPMGIDAIEKPRRKDARHSSGAHGFVILSLGRLVSIKGLEVAIQAISTTDAELWIAGEGPERSALERCAARSGARVRFFGVVSGSKKAELFAAADAFVAPSLREPNGRTEGVPTALLEAAEAGLPIVASAVGGIPEVFAHDRSALLVPPGDVAALTRALAQLATDAALRRRIGRAARTVGRRYLWPTLAPRIEELVLDQG